MKLGNPRFMDYPQMIVETRLVMHREFNERQGHINGAETHTRLLPVCLRSTFTR